MAFQGLGDTYIQTLDLEGGATAQKMQEVFLFEFEFTSESTNADALAYQSGVRKAKATFESEVTDSLILRIQYAAWADLGFALDEFPSERSAVKIPAIKYATVPAAAPHEIVDTAITVANDSFVFVNINARGAWGQPGPLDRATTPASPADREVGVDTAGTKLVFNAAQAGATIGYTVPVDYTSIEGYGGNNTAVGYGDIAFRGQLYATEQTERWPIYFPKLQRNGRPSFSFTGDIPTLEIPFVPITPSGWEKPYEILNLDTAVV